MSRSLESVVNLNEIMTNRWITEYGLKKTGDIVRDNLEIIRYHLEHKSLDDEAVRLVQNPRFERLFIENKGNINEIIKIFVHLSLEEISSWDNNTIQ